MGILPLNTGGIEHPMTTPSLELLLSIFSEGAWDIRLSTPNCRPTLSDLENLATDLSWFGRRNYALGAPAKLYFLAITQVFTLTILATGWALFIYGQHW